MSLTFQIEPVSGVWDEMIADWIDNWGEEYVSNGEIPNLRKDRYEEYERVGYYLQFVARDNGKLAGYMGVYLTSSMHTQELIASEDVVFMKPQYRGIGSVRFVKYVEKYLKERGAKSITATVKQGGAADRLLNGMGYKLKAVQLSKRLT